MSRILKFRKKRLSFSGEGVLQLGGEKEKVEKSYSTLVGNGLSLPRNVLSVNFKKIESWLKETLSQTNQTRLKQVNKRYIASLGERAVAQNLAFIPVYTLPHGTGERQNDSSSSLSFFLLKSLVSAQKPLFRSFSEKKKKSQPQPLVAESVRTESAKTLPQSKETLKGKKSNNDKQEGKNKKKGKSKA